MVARAQKVIDHYENPRNVGSLDKNDASVGTGAFVSTAWAHALMCRVAAPPARSHLCCVREPGSSRLPIATAALQGNAWAAGRSEVVRACVRACVRAKAEASGGDGGAPA